MRNLLLTVIAVMVAFVFGRLSAQDVQPSCDMWPTTHISKSEIDQYADLGRTDRRIDQQVRSIDIGKSNVQVAVAHRGRLAERAGRVAEHDLVTEVYYVLSGSGTVLTGPDLVNKQRRPADNRAVLYLNGPGHNAEDVRGGVVNELEAGDVFVIPAGTGHVFTRIDDHITYLMVRVDPDKVVPLMDEAASRAYLSAAR